MILNTPVGQVPEWLWPLVNSVIGAVALALGGYFARKLRRVDVIWQELFGPEGAESPNGLRADIRGLQDEMRRISGDAAESPAGRAIATEIGRLREDTMRTFGELARRVDRLEDRRVG